MQYYDQVYSLVSELVSMNKPGFRPVQTLVIGCSTSEIAGGSIGHASAPEIGAECAKAVLDAAKSLGFAPAFQCCEHLNRALVMEKRDAERLNLEIVSAVPHPKAGGSCASAAYRLMDSPVLVETVCADAGIDIGQTLIGMHLKRVAVPIRLSLNAVGSAIVSAARTRPALIGGERAKYTL